MIRRIGLVELRPKFRLLRPIEAAAIDDRPADARAVPADEFRQAIDHDVDAVIERPQQQRRDRVVADHRQALGMGDVGDRPVVEHVVLRIGHRFDIHRPGVRPNGLGDVLRIGGIDERHLDAQPLESLAEAG